MKRYGAPIVEKPEKKHKQQDEKYHPEWLKQVVIAFLIPDLAGIVIEYFFSFPHISGKFVTSRNIRQNPDSIWGTIRSMATVDGCLYVLDYRDDSILKYDESFQLKNSFKGREYRMMTYDKDRIYTSNENQDIYIRNSNVEFINKWITNMDILNFVVCGDEMIINHGFEFQVYNKTSGVWIRTWDRQSSYQNQMTAVPDCDLVLICAKLQDRVCIVNVKTGETERSIIVDAPSAAVVNRNNVYVACSSSIRVYDLDKCRFLYAWTVEKEPLGLIFFNDRLIISDSSGTFSVFE